MKISFNISQIEARIPSLYNLEDLKNWAQGNKSLNLDEKNPKPEFIPMMAARRMSTGCRFAVDLGLKLYKSSPISSVIFSSRIGELEHNYKLLEANANKQPSSPTNFSMSVHNSAVGNFTILAKAKIPSTSISSGIDSFSQALIEAYIQLQQYPQVLLVDYGVSVPEFFSHYSDPSMPDFPYALAMVLTKVMKSS